MKRTSKAMTFIRAAFDGAARSRRQAVAGAIREAIEHGMKFAIGDVTECDRLHDWYDGQPRSFYGAAVKSNQSFCLAYEADREFKPWFWPRVLCAGWEDSTESVRLHVGREIWYVHKGEARLWKVTSLSKDEIRIALVSDPKYKRCPTCRCHTGGESTAKTLARKTFTREQFAGLAARLASYRAAGILYVDGVIAWDVRPIEAGPSPDDVAWEGEFLSKRNGAKYGHGRVSTGVILKSRGVTLHGETLRKARGNRAARLRSLEEEAIRHLRDNGVNVRLDDPIPVNEGLLQNPYWESDAENRAFRALCRGNETITAREVLFAADGMGKAARQLYHRLDRSRRFESDQEYEARRKIAAEKELAFLQSHGDVQVTVSDSLDIGHCAMGAIAWLDQHFPVALKGVNLESSAKDNQARHDVLSKRLRKVKKTIAVGELLDRNEKDGLLRNVLLAAIKRATGETPDTEGKPT